MAESTPSLRITPLGGLGEIGLNCLAIQFQDDILVIDCGLMFPQENMLGIDFLIPDLSYLIAHRDKIRAFLFTHGHEDHIGALPFYIDQMAAPIYGAPFTLALLRDRLKERRPKGHHQGLDLRSVENEHFQRIGPFEIAFLPVSHSTPGSRALAIRTPVGLVVHSGDFKLDPTTHPESRFKEKTFADLGDEGVLLLLADSTNSLCEGRAVEERVVEHNLTQMVETAKGRTIVGVFSSHIQRIQQVLNIAHATKKKVAVSGRSLEESIRMTTHLGLLHVPMATIIEEAQVRRFPKDQTVILSTGSQGEMRAVLPRIAKEEHPHIAVEPGDTVIVSARMIPGNEKSVHHMMNAFARLGANVQYGSFSDLQASGHAYGEEQESLLKLLRPKFFIPVHGEYRHLQRHMKRAMDMGMGAERTTVLENGETMELNGDAWIKTAKIPTGRFCVYNHFWESTHSSTLKERRELARGGVVTLVVQADSTKCPTIQTVQTLGTLEETDCTQLKNDLQKELLRAIEMNLGDPHAKDFIEKTVRRYFRGRIGRKPAVIVHRTP